MVGNNVSRAVVTMAISDERIRRGMAAQMTARAARLRSGDTPLGWKLGFGTPAAMKKLGLRFPMVGFLTGNARLPTEGSVALQSFTRAASEPEIAVHMGADLGADADESTVRSAIAALGPAIEVADLNFPADDVERILAGNIYQRNVILGPADYSRAGARLDGLSARLFQDGDLRAETNDMEANPGNIISLVRGLADHLAELGLKLGAGDVVITGSIVPPLIVERPCDVSFRLHPFDPIAVQFT